MLCNAPAEARARSPERQVLCRHGKSTDCVGSVRQGLHTRPNPSACVSRRLSGPWRICWQTLRYLSQEKTYYNGTAGALEEFASGRRARAM